MKTSVVCFGPDRRRGDGLGALWVGGGARSGRLPPRFVVLDDERVHAYGLIVREVAGCHDI